MLKIFELSPFQHIVKTIRKKQSLCISIMMNSASLFLSWVYKSILLKVKELLLCVKKCEGPKVSPYLQIHILSVYSLTSAGRTPRFPELGTHCPSCTRMTAARELASLWQTSESWTLRVAQRGPSDKCMCETASQTWPYLSILFFMFHRLIITVFLDSSIWTVWKESDQGQQWLAHKIWRNVLLDTSWIMSPSKTSLSSLHCQGFWPHPSCMCDVRALWLMWQSMKTNLFSV